MAHHYAAFRFRGAAAAAFTVGVFDRISVATPIAAVAAERAAKGRRKESIKIDRPHNAFGRKRYDTRLHSSIQCIARKTMSP